MTAEVNRERRSVTIAPEKLKQFRKEVRKFPTQLDAAEASLIHRNTIRVLMNGGKTASPETDRKIDAFLDSKQSA